MDRPLVRPWWQSKRGIRAGMLAGALVLGLAVAWTLTGTPEHSVRLNPDGVVTSRVEQKPFHDSVPLRAKVVALETVYLDALEGGRVEQVLTQAGDFVAQGQQLVVLSNTELELDVLDREARLIESATQLQAYETQLEQNRIANQKALAQIDYDIVRLQRALQRRKQLVERSMEAAEVRDAMQDELDFHLKTRPAQMQSNQQQEALRVRQIPQIQNQLEKLHRDMAITHSKLENLIVRAPVAGRLTAMDLKVGENRNRGERFAEITPETGHKLSAKVDEYYLGQVRSGQIADMESGGRTWRVSVTRVYPQVKDGTFTVDLGFDGSEPDGLLPGQAMQGTLRLGEDRSALVIDSGAFLEQTGGQWIFVMDNDGRSAVRRAVQLGRRNADQVEVLGNLRAGEKVIVSDYTGLERIEHISFEE